jgi:hypothetical protein
MVHLQGRNPEFNPQYHYPLKKILQNDTSLSWCLLLEGIIITLIHLFWGSVVYSLQKPF